MNVKAIQIGPAYVQLHLDTQFGKVVILQICCPVEPLMQKVVHRFYGPRGAGPFLKFLIYAESVMVCTYISTKLIHSISVFLSIAV